MDRINDLKDETIKTLAQTLKQSGLAASESEAIRMASNMANTNKKANDTFEQRREKNIMGLSFLHKEKKEKTNNQEIKEEVTYAEEDDKKSHIKSETPINSNDNAKSDDTLNNLFEAETKDEFIEQDLIKEKQKQSEQTEKQEQPETTTEIPVEEKPKKDLNEYEESKVDLGSVFKFKN